MTQGEFSVTIAAPPETVWPWISQLEKHVEWSSKPYSVEWLSGEPNAVGSRYRSVGWVPGDKDHVNEGVITEVVPNQRFALRADDKEGPFENTYVLKPSGGGTEVTFSLVFPKMKGVMAALVPVVFATMGKPDTRRRMEKLKATVEAAT
ncbi:MAG TPA: SRPBCC family protein [Actinomycetota bacterium]|nr:SRPBCC family protein [Actinomycetota bacterium]